MRPQAASTSPLGVECRNHRHNDDRALPDLLLLLDDDDSDDDNAGFDLSLMLPSLHCASPSPFIHCCVHHHIAPSLALDYVDLLQESRSDVRFRASPFDLRRLCDVRRPSVGRGSNGELRHQSPAARRSSHGAAANGLLRGHARRASSNHHGTGGRRLE